MTRSRFLASRGCVGCQIPGVLSSANSQISHRNSRSPQFARSPSERPSIPGRVRFPVGLYEAHCPTGPLCPVYVDKTILQYSGNRLRLWSKTLLLAATSLSAI